MTDIWCEEKRSEVMSKIRGKDTEPELEIKKILEGEGIPFEHQPKVGGWRVDFLVGDEIILEYRSCFWHFCPQHGKVPKSNQGYWKPKLEKNKERDETKDEDLRKKGYGIEVIWTHDDLEQRIRGIVDSHKIKLQLREEGEIRKDHYSEKDRVLRKCQGGN